MSPPRPLAMPRMAALVAAVACCWLTASAAHQGRYVGIDAAASSDGAAAQASALAAEDDD